MKEGWIRSSEDPSSNINREEIPVRGSQQIKSDSCWTTCVYLNILGPGIPQSDRTESRKSDQ